MRRIVQAAALAVLALFWLRFAGAQESYTILKIGDATSGFGKSATVEKKEGAEILFETTMDQTTRIARLDTKIEFEQSVTTLEDSKGIIRKVSSRILMAKDPQVYEGVVVGDTMKVTLTTAGKPRVSEIDWSDDIPGPREQNRRLAATGFKKGEKVVFYLFDFSTGDPFRTTFTCEGDEEVVLPTGKKTLHRFHVVADSPAVPPSTRWVDDTGESRRDSYAMLGLAFDSLDATKEQYTEAGGSRGAEIFVQSMIRSNVRLEKPRSLVEITYRIHPKTGDVKIELQEDEHQRWIEDPQTKQRVLIVRAVTPGGSSAQKVNDPELGAKYAEFLAPNGMIQSDDPKIVAFATKAIGDEPNAWKAAQKLESAVCEHIKNKNMGVGFASATETFESCEGDCSEHAVLLAAACRAAGIPARVAMGLLYVNMGENGEFGGHAWCEVAIDGKWYGLDGTLGLGSADPTHIRFSATSLRNGALAADFGGIVKNLGQIDVEILASK